MPGNICWCVNNIKKWIKLVKNEKGLRFIWYNLGVKMGVKIEQGMAVPTELFKEAEKLEKKRCADSSCDWFFQPYIDCIGTNREAIFV